VKGMRLLMVLLPLTLLIAACRGPSEGNFSDAAQGTAAGAGETFAVRLELRSDPTVGTAPERV